MAETDLQLLTRCADFSLDHIHSVEEKVKKALETSGATRLVMALRICRLQRAVTAVGMFSLFESLLKTGMSWEDPFSELGKYLRKHGENLLADNIDDYFRAINALKHGRGSSHNKLLTRSNLEFKVKAESASFFEGDVSEVGVLVDANDQFVRRCAELIQEVLAVIYAKDGIWL
jgi:hypothetical protein